MRKLMQEFWRDETAVSSIEYGLIASLIAIVAIAAMKNIGSRVKLTFGDIGNNLSSF